MTAADPPAPLSRPWRSAPVGWAVAAVALVVQVPLFLRSPPWCDLTLYEVAARNLLAGGVHYRDVFDTNTPGFVWALVAVRAVLGPSWEAVKAVDLLIVAGITGLLGWLARRGGAGRGGLAWFAAGVAVLYPSLPEINHCQRDVWMLLPAAAAVALRVGRPTPILEGVLWGLAVWVKPHVAVPAAAVWLATARRPGWVGDLVGNVAGGLLAGVAGVGYLVASGTWPHFVDVFTTWNTGYAAQMWSEWPKRSAHQLDYFPPWTYLQLLAVPVAAASVVDGWRPFTSAGGRLWRPAADEPERSARLAVSALYLGWTAQAFAFQRPLHYVHVPETLLLFAVLATQRWAAVPVLLAWLAVVPLIAERPPDLSGAGAVPGNDAGWRSRHPLTDPARLRLWPDCLRPSLSSRERAELWDKLAQIRGFHAANGWVELDEMAAEVRRRGVADGELLCWDDAPHALYLVVGVRPGFRFQHVNQMRGIGPAQHDRVMGELCGAARRVRWVVGDLYFLQSFNWPSIGELTDTGPDGLPRGLSDGWRAAFPYYLPLVYRTKGGQGRYVLYRLDGPAAVRECGDR